MGCLRKNSSHTSASEFATAGLETLDERRARRRSLHIVYFTIFMMTLGFSSILTGVWPYLNQLDPHAGKQFLGFVVAANPLGQMLFSPLFGTWGNRAGSIRGPVLLSLVLFLVGSGGYALLETLPSHSVRYWMLATRFIVGVSSANVAVCRSYVSAATTVKERTGAVGMLSLAQVLGFIIGPAMQMLASPLGQRGMSIGSGLSLNMYTATGWVSVLLSMVNIVFFLPGVFSERKIAAREAMHDQGVTTEKDTWSGKKPDYLAVWSLICAFFIFSFNFVMLETLATSLVMDQFALTNQEALYYMGLLMTAGGVVAVITFTLIKCLCRWFDERAVLLVFGFVLMVIAQTVFIPWGNEPPLLKMPGAELNETAANVTESLGCPVDSQPWCAYTPAMSVTQLLLGYALISFGYPIGITLIQTVFSKVLGARPQGVWMGLLTGSGCLSRMLGPVFVMYVYVQLGTVWTFAITAVVMVLFCVWLRLVYSRLVPLRVDLPAEQPQQARLIEMKTYSTKTSSANGTLSEELQRLS